MEGLRRVEVGQIPPAYGPPCPTSPPSSCARSTLVTPDPLPEGEGAGGTAGATGKSVGSSARREREAERRHEGYPGGGSLLLEIRAPRVFLLEPFQGLLGAVGAVELGILPELGDP